MSGELARLGERIKKQRQRLGMTQTELAGDNVTRNMLSRIEHGAALPSLPTLVALASRLGLPAGALLDEPDDYLEYKLICHLRRLYAAGQYREVLDKCASYGVTAPGDELSALLCSARTAYARELFDVGRLGDAMEQLNKAQELAESCGFDLSAAGEEIFLLRLMIDACPALLEEDAPSPALRSNLAHLRASIFDRNELAIYLCCRAELAEITHRAYSDPHPDIESLRTRLEPLTEGLSSALYRGHIAAKLDMAAADYLGAKATLTKLAADSVPPAILYELYADLEHCCKCCGDFENAYKYSGLRLELIKKIV